MRMRRDRSGWLDRDTSERLLDGGYLTAEPAQQQLTRLLGAAAAPPRPGELDGEDRAVAAFRARYAAPGSVAATTRRHHTRWAAAWIGGIAAVATAGVAMAAVSLVHPDPGPSPSGRPAPSGGRATETLPEAAPSWPGPAPTVTGSLGDSHGEPATRRLCTAYLARPAAERGRLVNTPAFRQLIIIAGGPEQVDDYCQRMLTPSPMDPDGGRVRPGQSPSAAGPDHSEPGRKPS